MSKSLNPGVVIIGLNELTRTVLDILELLNQKNILGVIDLKETSNLDLLKINHW